MSILSTLKRTFAPSPSVSAARRQSVFGTTSKTVAASVIVGGAVAAIAAPAAIAATGGARVVGSLVASKVASLSAKQFVVAGIATPIIAGAVYNSPSIVTKTPTAVGSTVGNLFKFGEKPSFETFGNIYKENPVVAGAATAALIGAIGGGVVAGTTSLLNTSAIRAQTEQLREITGNAQPPSLSASTGNQITPSSESTTGISTTGPITPATQVLGKSASTGIAKRRTTKNKQVSTQNFRINIINANQSRLTTKRYISGY